MSVKLFCTCMYGVMAWTALFHRHMVFLQKDCASKPAPEAADALVLRIGDALAG